MKDKYNLEQRYKKLFWEDRMEYLKLVELAAKPINSAFNRIKTFFYVMCFFLSLALMNAYQIINTNPEVSNSIISQGVQLVLVRSPLPSIIFATVLCLGAIIDTIDIKLLNKRLRKNLDNFLKERGL